VILVILRRQDRYPFVHLRPTKSLVLALLLIALTACQGDSTDLLACETVDDLSAKLAEGTDLQGYVASAELLADQVAEADDQLLRDVGTSLYIVALSWAEADFTEIEMFQANQSALILLTDRCTELRS
jgi:hypothetical protein